MTSSPEYLKRLATHFAPEDWGWTRHHKLTKMQHVVERDWDRFWPRLGRAIKGPGRDIYRIFPREKQSNPFLRLRNWLYGRIAWWRVSMDRNDLPDGVLKGAGVYSMWEENGEYIQMVQPSVGELLANFLIEEPEHPHAKLITAELDRLSARYSERIKNGEVS